MAEDINAVAFEYKPNIVKAIREAWEDSEAKSRTYDRLLNEDLKVCKQ